MAAPGSGGPPGSSSDGVPVAFGWKLFMDAQAGYLEAVDSALLLQEQAVEAGFRLRELSGTTFSPVSTR